MNLKDPTVVAETELLNAAAAIEAAAKKLEELRPRPQLVLLYFEISDAICNNYRKLTRS